MNVAAVPESVTQSQVCDLLAALGVDPKDVPRGASLTLGPKSITIEVFARNEAGELYPGPGDRVAMHRISIPIVEDNT